MFIALYARESRVSFESRGRWLFIAPDTRESIPGARPPLGGRGVVEEIRMKLPAERAEALLERGALQVQPVRQTHEGEVVAMSAERQDLRALRTEVGVDRRAAAAVATHLKRGGC